MIDRRVPRHTLGGYTEYDPPERLRPCTEALWYHRTPLEVAVEPGTSHRVLPDPSLSIAFTCHRDDAGRASDGQVIVVGPVTTPRAFPIQPSFEMAAVKLKLEWVEPLLGVSPTDHEDVLDDLLPLSPSLAAPLLDALAETRSADDAIGILAVAVERLFHQSPIAHDGLARHALDMIRRTGGRIGMRHMAEQFGTSDRHLRRVVQRAAGLGLKVYARTIRFLGAVTTADRTRRPPWARLAAECGFSDQAHLIRECRALSGLPPDQLHRERRGESEMSNSA